MVSLRVVTEQHDACGGGQQWRPGDTTTQAADLQRPAASQGHGSEFL